MVGFTLSLLFFLGAGVAIPMMGKVVPNSPENLYRLRHLKEGENAEELSGQFEGDIILTEQQLSELQQRNGLGVSAARWASKTVPYVLSGPFTEEQEAYIRRGLDTLELATCVKFVPRTSQLNYVDVTSTDSGCFSNVGRTGLKQQLNLQATASTAIETGCLRLATIMHEFVHAVGFFHMQSTYNRDDYVFVALENVESGMELNFWKYPRQTLVDYGIEYDYNSIMHYGPYGFSANGKPTLVAKDPLAKIGQRVGLSRRDIEKINQMYECPLNG